MQWIPFSITVSTSRCNNSLSNLHSWRPKSREVKKIVGESVIYCYSRLQTSCLDKYQKLSKFESGEPQSDVRKAMTHLYYGYVKLIRVCHTYMGMSHLYGYVKLIRVCHTCTGMSHLYGFVTLIGVCQTCTLGCVENHAKLYKFDMLCTFGS